jgi:mitochondrial enoyl-[acyl-carrier protein] reductase / trans-2-enoyl-CoA reductase
MPSLAKNDASLSFASVLLSLGLPLSQSLVESKPTFFCQVDTPQGRIPVKGLQIAEYGNPADVVKLVEIPDVGAPGPGEIVIHVVASSIEPTDLYMAQGVYAYLPPLPHLLGCQGVGRVSAVGRGVKDLKEGDLTLVPPLANAWVNRVKTNAPWLRPLPKGDVNQLSMLGINPPTAYLLLTYFVPLKKGDWVIQNGANSSVGRAVIAIAKAKGIHTVNVVRRSELIAELRALGGDVVLVDGPDLPQRVAIATGKANIGLGLDCVGDSATQNLLNSISKFGFIVVYSGMSGKPLTVSGPQLLFNGQTLLGWWIVNWFRAQKNYDKVTEVYGELAPMIASGAISLPVVGEFDLEQYREALVLAGKFKGKVIFRPNGRQ